MTEFPHDQDELASAYLDDDVTAEERARVDGDPSLLARVDELRSVREALASAPVESPSTAERDAAINVALSASNVVDLTIARGRRRLRIASIAAAILLVLGAAGLLIRAAADQSTDKLQTVAGALSTTTAGPTAERAATGSATAGAAGGFSTAGREALGSFADRPSLTTAARAQVHNLTRDQTKQADASTFAPTAGGAGAADSAPPTVCPVSSPPDAVNEIYAAAAILQGRPVQVDVFTIADGTLTLVVTDSASCTEVFSQSI